MEEHLSISGIIVVQDGVRAVGLSDIQNSNLISPHDLGLLVRNDMMRSVFAQWPLTYQCESMTRSPCGLGMKSCQERNYSGM